MTPAMLIFLPVRNGGAYLSEAIDSIRAQTVADWQLVVLENGSTDDSVARVERYGDPRIVLQQANAPLDIQPNWQRAISYLRETVSGDPLITFIGHDDLFAPDFVATVLEIQRTHPSATLYQTHFDTIDGAGALIRPCRPIPERETGADLAAQLCWALRDSFGTGYAFRASDHLKVGGWPDLPRLLYSDHLLFIRLAALGYKATSPASGCSYRRHAGSTSAAPSRDNLIAYLGALDLFVTALEAELPSFVHSDHGHNALAALLARELAPYRLAPALRVLDEAGRAALARLQARFAQVDRGLSPAIWTKLHVGRYTAAIGLVRDIVASARLRRAMRH